MVVARSLVPGADQINDRFVAEDKCGVNCVRGKEVSVSSSQLVSFMSDAQLQLAAQDPVRLIFSMCVRAVFRAGRIAPLEDTVAFGAQLILQLVGLRSLRFAPSFDLNVHEIEVRD